MRHTLPRTDAQLALLGVPNCGASVLDPSPVSGAATAANDVCHAEGRSPPDRRRSPPLTLGPSVPWFSISIVRADGTSETYHRQGGSSIEHTLEALEDSGVGGVIRVIRVDLGAAS